MGHHMAYETLQEIRKLAAFSIQGATRRNVNQHMREYTFPDGSKLRLYRSGRGLSVSPQGFGDCVSLIRANTFGV